MCVCVSDTNEEALLKQALEMSMAQESGEGEGEGEVSGQTSATLPDLAAMSEEDQIAYALQMSMASESGRLQVSDVLDHKF